MEYPFIIEFLGISGSGKSIRTFNLAHSLREDGIKVWTRTEQKRFSISFLSIAFSLPLATIKFLTDKQRKEMLSLWNKAARDDSSSYISAKVKWWAWMDMWRLFEATQKGDNNLVILDEGMLQHLVSARVGKQMAGDRIMEFISAYKRYTNKCMTVIIEISPESCVQRLFERGRLPQRLNGFSREEILLRLREDEQVIAAIKNKLLNAGADVITVAGMDIENDVKILTDKIKKNL